MKSLGIFGILSVSATFLLSSCATETNVHSVSSYHNYRGIDYYEKGRLDNSVQEFKKAVETRPNSEETHSNLGIAYHENGEHDKATMEFKEALKINPRNAGARSALGNIYMDNGNLDEALLQFKEAIEANGNYADAHNNLGNVYWAMGWREQAVLKYKDAIELNPNLDIAYVNLGRAYKEMGMLDQAIEELTKARKLSPYMPDTHYYMAEVYYGKGMLEDAVSEYKKSISLYGPDAPPDRIAAANARMALAYYKAGKYDEAVSGFKKVLEIAPDMVLTIKPEGKALSKTSSAEVLKETISKEKTLAESYSLMGENDKALKQWRNVIVHCLDTVDIPGARIEEGVIEEALSSFNRLFQADTFGREAQRVYLRIGQAYLEKGNREEAQLELKKALDINPTLLEARLKLVRTFIKEDLEEAAREAERAELLYPSNGEVKILLGDIYLKRGMLGDARVKYNEALKLSPRSVRAHNNLGVVHVGQNRLDDAITEYLAAMEIDPTSPRIHMNLGRAYYRKGMKEAASLEFDRALEMNPNLAGAHEGKAMIDEDMGRWEEAVNGYEQALKLFNKSKYLQEAEIHDRLAAIYSKKSMTKQAINELLKAVELRLAAIKDYDTLGLSCYSGGSFEEAVRNWERSVRLNPVLAKRYERLGMYYSRAAMYDEGILVYKKAASMYRQNENKALMHYNIADIMVEEDLLENAISEYEKAIELDPKLARAHTGLGLAYDKKGMLKRAVHHHKKALEIDPNLAEAHKNLGLCYHKQGFSKEARKEFAIYNNITLKE